MRTPRWMDQATADEFSWKQTLGGTRGVIEASAPGLVFVIVYVATRSLTPTLIAACAVALIASAIRLAQRQDTTRALSGFFGVAIGVIVAAATGRGENYFAWGILTNAVMALAFGASVLARHSIVAGLYSTIVGSKDDNSASSREGLRRRCDLLTCMWAGIFFLRVAVQTPLWAAGQVAALGVVKLALGLPLFALGTWATWWGLRGYSSSGLSSDSTATN